MNRSPISAHVVALISDIHGNQVALRRVLDGLAAQGVDEIVCLGDVAATGPNPRECLDLLAERAVPVVLGNADDWLLHPTFSAEAGTFHRQVEEVDAWCAEQLSQDNWRYLRSFQPVLRPSTPAPLLCFHGTPRSNTEIVEATTPTETLVDVFAEHPETWLAGGHTHQQLVRRFREQILINPGSVGLGYQTGRDGKTRNVPWAEYALLTWRGDGMGVELRRVPVEVEAIRAAILHSGMPHAEQWAAGW